ncbi:MAG TPA: hypothetical protein VEB23_10080 [Ramlibacter sp.]|nr:hypothetical protein [Ramlibacter sp.]
MKQVEYFRWWLPPAPGSGPRAKRRLSSWKMDATEAARHGAIGPEPSTRELRLVPEPGDPVYHAAGRDGVR